MEVGTSNKVSYDLKKLNYDFKFCAKYLNKFQKAFSRNEEI
jgi:hypothetical protein